MASRHHTHSIMGDDAVPPSGDPVIEVTGDFDFGTSPVGTPKSKVFTIRNNGDAALTLTLPVTITGAGFSVTSQPGETTIAPDETTSFTVEASAAAHQTYNATINIVNNSNDTPHTDDITIVAVQAVISLTGVGGNAITNGSSAGTANGTDFGTTPVGTTDSLNVTASNTGDANLSITAIGLPTGFTHNAVLPLTITPGNNSVITITSTAAAFDRWAGNVTFTNNSAVSSFSFGIESKSLPAGTYLETVHFGYGNGEPTGLVGNGDGEVVESYTTAEAIVYSPPTVAAKPKWFQSVSGMNNRGAVEFAGDDFLQAVAAVLGSQVGDWTWAIVIRTNVTGAVTIVSEGNNPTNAPHIRMRQATADATAQIRDGASVSANAPGTKDINDGLPHLLVMRKDSAANMIYFYIDNLVTPQASASTATLGTVTLNRSVLGALARATVSEHFTGQMGLSLKFAGNNLANCGTIKPHYAIA
jgi:hypothetical protein